MNKVMEGLANGSLNAVVNNNSPKPVPLANTNMLNKNTLALKSLLIDSSSSVNSPNIASIANNQNILCTPAGVSNGGYLPTTVDKTVRTNASDLITDKEITHKKNQAVGKNKSVTIHPSVTVSTSALPTSSTVSTNNSRVINPTLWTPTNATTTPNYTHNSSPSSTSAPTHALITPVQVKTSHTTTSNGDSNMTTEKLLYSIMKSPHSINKHPNPSSSLLLLSPSDITGVRRKFVKQ